MRLRFMCTILCAVCNQFWALLRALAHCGGPKAFKIRELEWAIADVSDCSRDEVVALHTSDTIAPAMTPTQRSVLREGIVAGLLGAAVVAVWFLFFDLARGRPLLTPGLLGAAVFQGVTDPIGLEIAPGNVLGYTLLHGLAFVAFGVIAASGMAGREGRPHPPRLPPPPRPRFRPLRRHRGGGEGGERARPRARPPPSRSPR